MANEIRIPCKRCKRASPSNSFYLDNASRIMVCKNCYEEINGKTANKPPIKPYERTEFKEKKSFDVVCAKCNYKYVVKEFLNKRCPYCGFGQK